MKTKLLQGLALLVGLIGAAFLAQPASAATYTVTNTADSGAGSLRQAITDANANGGSDTIDFNIAGAGPHTITVGATELPEITGPTIVDGTTQTDSSCGELVPATLPSASNTPHNIQIVIDGSNITWINYEQGILHFINGSDGSEVRGVAFVNAGSAGPDYITGISIGDLGSGPVSGVLIECNYFGIMPDGTTEAPNYGSNIQARYEVSGIVVRNNLITSAQGGGLALYDNNFPYTSSGNIVEDNLFGTLADGLTAASYNQQLLSIENTAAANIQNNIIGASSGFINAVTIYNTLSSQFTNNYIGLNINQGSIINTSSGISFTFNEDSNITNNQIANSSIGLNWYGNTGNSNATNNGIFNNQSIGAYVGGDGFASNNIYNNGSNGVELLDQASIADSFVYSNGGDGIFYGAGDNGSITGNYVGVDQSMSPAGNSGDGIQLGQDNYYTGVTGTSIGGPTTDERNVISDNAGNGIRLFNNRCGLTMNNTINGNFIGTNNSGEVMAGFGNGESGITVNEIIDPDDCNTPTSIYKNQIGGDNTGEANVIAGNNEDGIRMYSGQTEEEVCTEYDPDTFDCLNWEFETVYGDVFSNVVLPNSIHNNGNLGINLAADTDNSGVANQDLGPNPLNNNLMSYPAVNANYYLNRPTVNTATFSGNDITVNYDFQANGVQDNDPYLLTTDLIGYRLDFYLNDAGQDGAYAGYSQGKTHIGSFVVNGSETNASHIFTSPVTPVAGQVVTSTATVLWQNIPYPCPGPGGRYGDGPPYSSTSCE